MATGILLNGMTVSVAKLTPANSAFVVLEGIKGDVGFGQLTRDSIETTAHGDTTRTYIAGLADAGEISFSMNWIPKSPTDTLLMAIQETGETVNLKITTPGLNGNTTNTYSQTWSGYLSEYNRSAPHDDVATADITFKLSNKVA